MDNLYVLTGEEQESHGYLNEYDIFLFIIRSHPTGSQVFTSCFMGVIAFMAQGYSYSSRILFSLLDVIMGLAWHRG